MGFLGKLGDAMLGGIPSVLGSVVGAIGGSIQQNKEQKFNAEEAEKARQFNAEEAEKARQFNSEEAEIARQYQTSEREATQQWNLDQWNRENEYNSPAAQMQRAVEAGLNPNSVAAGMSGGATAGRLMSSPMSGAAASGPAAAGAAASGPSVAGTIASLIGNSTNTVWQDYLLKKQAEGQDIQNEYDSLSMDDRLGLLKDQRSEIQSQLKLNDQEWKQAEEMFPYLLSEKQSDIQLKLKQIDELVSQINLQNEQAETESKKRELMDSEIDVNASVVDLNEEKANESRAMQRKLDSENRELLWKEGLRNIGFDPDNNAVGNMLMNGYKTAAETGDVGNNPALKTLKNVGKIVDVATWVVPIGVGAKGVHTGYKMIKSYKAAKAAKAAQAARKADVDKAFLDHWKSGTLWNPNKSGKPSKKGK